MASRRRKPRRASRPSPPAAATRPSGPPGPEEARLLRVARELAALARGGRPPGEALGEALARLSYVEPPREARSPHGPRRGRRLDVAQTGERFAERLTEIGRAHV